MRGQWTQSDVGLVWVINEAILSLSLSNPGVSYSLSCSMSSWSVLGCSSMIPLPFLHTLFVCVLKAIRFVVDAVEVEEVKEVAVLIVLWLGFGVEWGDVE